MDEFDKSIIFNGVDVFEWNFSFRVAFTFTSSVKTSIVFSFKFSLAKADTENSSVGTSIDISCLFSLKFTLTIGSVRLVEPSALSGLSCVCKTALFILGLKRVSFLTSYENSNFVLAGNNFSIESINSGLSTLFSTLDKLLTTSTEISLSSISCFLRVKSSS